MREGGYSNLSPLPLSKRRLFDDLARNSQAQSSTSPETVEEPKPHILDEKRRLVSE